MKKILSAIMAVVFLFTTVGVNAAVTEITAIRTGDAGTVAIGNSYFEWSHTSNRSSTYAYDGTYTIFEGEDATVTATSSFEVKDTGAYTLEIYGAASVTNAALSDISFSIDGGNSVVLNSGNSTVTALSNSCVASGIYEVKSVKYNTALLLEAGTHTVVFTVPQSSNNKTEAYFALDCAKFAPTDAYSGVNSEAPAVFGNSSFDWSYKMWGNSEKAADGTYTIVEGAGLTVTATRTFYVEDTGEYNFEVYGASSVTNLALSNLSYQIDDGASAVLNSSSSTVTSLADPCRTSDPWTTKDIKLKKSVLLNEGIHTLTFTVPKNSNGRTEAYFVFDCAIFTPTDYLLKVNGNATATIGNSDFTWNHTEIIEDSESIAYDGTYTKFEGGGATITATKQFYVEDTGDYALEVYAASSITNEALSNLEFKIDEGASTVLNSSSATVEELSDPCIASGTYKVKNIKYKTNIFLAEGIHTVTFTVPQNSNGRTEAYFAFDCANLIPKNLVVKLGSTTTTIGNSEFSWNHKAIAESADAYDGTYTIFNGAGATITATKTLYAEKKGAYEIEVYGASSATNNALSHLEFKIDGGASTTLKASNSTVTALPDPCRTGDPWTVKSIKYNASYILLEEGEHTLTFTVPQNSNGRTTGAFVFDCVSLIPTNVESMGIYSTNEIVTYEVTRETSNQEPVVFKVYDINGNKVKEDQFTSKQKTETFSLGSFKPGWYRVKVYTSGTENNIFASFSVVDERNGVYPNSPFAIMHLGRMAGMKDVFFVDALKKLSVGTARTEEIADINKANRPYEVYNNHFDDAGISTMSTVETNYTYPGTTKNGNIGGFTDLLDVYAVHKSLAQAYNGSVDYWELINEPDLNDSASADAYASWFKAAAIGITDANSDAIKAFGGLCVSNSQYFDNIMANGIMKYSDTVNVHSHTTDDEEGNNYNGTLADLGKVYSALYGNNAPLWSTESGLRMTVEDDNNELPSYEALKRQARYMITSFMETIGKHGVNKNFWFLASHYTNEGPEYGTFSKNNMPYPAVSSFNVLTDNLKNGVLLGSLKGVEDAEGYFFDCGEYDAAVIWKTTSGSKNIQLHTGGNVSIVQLVGNSDIKTYSPSTGRVSFDITEDPVLVRLSGKANSGDYVKTAFGNNIPTAKAYTDAADRIVLQQIWDPKPEIRSGGAYTISSGTTYTVKCRIYNFNSSTQNVSYSFDNSNGIVLSGASAGSDSVPANSYVEKQITLSVSSSGTNYSLQNLAFYAQTGSGEEIAPSISQMRIQNEQSTDGISINAISGANYYSTAQGDDISSQVTPNITNGSNSVTYAVSGLKNSDVPAQLYIYQKNLSVSRNSDGMYFKFNCNSFPSGFEKIYFDVTVRGAEGSFEIHDLFEFDGSTKNKNVFIPWSEFVHTSSNAKITDPSAIKTFKFGFDKSSTTAYSLSFTVSSLGTYSSQSAEIAESQIEISGLVNGGEYRQKDAKATVTTNNAANTEIYVNYQKVNCEASGSGVFNLDFSEYEPGEYSVVVAVSDRFNRKNYKQIKFTLLKDFVYFK